MREGIIRVLENQIDPNLVKTDEFIAASSDEEELDGELTGPEVA